MLARRIVDSATFARSEQLPKLLLYVCKMAIAERVDEINEQRIGVEVFGRPRDYDPAVDGIVRSHATRLRQRLELYFSSEGAHEPLRIEIPRGGYVPHFYSGEKSTHAVLAPVAAMEESSSIAVTEVHAGAMSASDANPRRGRKWGLPFLAGLLLAALTILVVGHFRNDDAVAAAHSDVRQTEIERRFWSSLFPSNGRTLVVPGDSGLVLYETVTGREITLGDYLSGIYRDPGHIEANTQGKSAASQKLSADLASRRYTSIIDLQLASQLQYLPQWSRQHAVVVYARDLRPQDADASNLILIGSKEANPWVSLVQPSMNFILVPDNKWGFHFQNRNPLKGEAKEYAPQESSGAIGSPAVYGDVAYLPNPGGNGMVLVLSGLWMSGTQSAGNFVLHGNHFSDWLRSIANPDGSIPPFEVLISTKSLENSAMDSFIVAKRVYRK